MDVDHVLLTRFNLPTVGAESLIRAREGWLRERVALFERYCLPSVAAQSATTFEWLVYFDPESPAWLKERISGWQSVLTPVFRATVDRAELLADIESTLERRGKWLITTNLDNDDGLARDFVERIQSAESVPRRHAIYCDNGLIRRGDGLYLRNDPENAFCSVREPWDGASTCWVDWHNLLGRSMEVIHVKGVPGWLQVVHESNVSNRVRGRLVSPASYLEIFEVGALSGVESPTASEIAHDRWVARPQRACRDLARSVGRRTALRLLGKDGFDRLKAQIATLRTGTPAPGSGDIARSSQSTPESASDPTKVQG
ncbi:hypothetical protein E8D34_20365 [Nocardioides sp. GY 10113]|uniref:glycosyltransferase n=1 Tax=Nocardioides sp. GY 10113 TaxID=2569761 RepID=UPI0010A8BE1B|nr:glycosyltransferase [Nocardioides sp. GY 10113]TIC79530.1 hypothetical protein E8D34_20365 [Nocardioides sp. GY 10113]